MQFAHQELKSANIRSFYYANDDSRGEIDFMVDIGDAVVPLEVKSGKNISARSLREFKIKHPESHPVITSTLPIGERGDIKIVPLYEICRIRAMR